MSQVSIKVNFFNQHFSIVMELPVNYSEITVHDFVSWAIEHADDLAARDIFMAIKDGHVSSFEYLRTDRENGTRYPINDKKKLAAIIWKKGNPSKITHNITLSASFLLPCKRCGLCCYDVFRCEYLGPNPPDDGIYYLEIDKTPCKIHVPEKMHVYDLGNPLRCAHLMFDGEIGLYGCKIHDGIRSPACPHYSCDYMILNKKDSLESEFGNIPTFPVCSACKEKDCITCLDFPVQIEWFIAHIRHNKIGTREMEIARFLKKKISKYELAITTNANDSIKKYADARWFDPYKKILDEIVEGPSKRKEHHSAPTSQENPYSPRTSFPRASSS
jgi:hypothetical protein